MQPETEARSMGPLSIPIRIVEKNGRARSNDPVRLGVPLRRGFVIDESSLAVKERTGLTLPHQLRVLARWPDGSVKWVLLDLQVTIDSDSESIVYLHREPGPREPYSDGLSVREEPDSITVDTGAAIFFIDRTSHSLIDGVTVDGQEIIDAAGLSVVLTDLAGQTYSACVDDVRVEEVGPLRATVTVVGSLCRSRDRTPATFVARLSFFSGHGIVAVDFGLRNPKAARHEGNLWDLGDPGSFIFSDLSLEISLSGKSESLHCYTHPNSKLREYAIDDWSLYQDSSGGSNWKSSNHVNAAGESSVNFRGYRISASPESSAANSPTTVLTTNC